MQACKQLSRTIFSLSFTREKLLFCFKLIVLFSFFYYPSFCVHAQPLDSLRKKVQQATNPVQKSHALAKYSFTLSSENADTALLLAAQSVQLATIYKNDTALAEGYHATGWCYFRLGKKDSAEYYLKKAQALFAKQKNINDEGITLINLSTIYNEYHEYSKSLTCLIAARPLLENVKNENMLAYLDRTVGVVYRQEGLYKQSAEYFRSAIATFKKLNNPESLADTYTSYGSVFYYQKAYDSALYYYRKAYNIYKSNSKNIIQAAYAAEDMALAFYEKANEQNISPWIDSSFKYYTIALNAFIKMGERENIEQEHANVGEVLRIMKQYNASAAFLTEAYRYFDSANNPNSAYEVLSAIIKLYRDMRDYKKAYDYTLLQQTYKDTIDNRNKAEAIAKMFAQFETEKKDRTIKLLNAQAKLDEQKIVKQHIIEIFSLISVGLAIVLFIVLFNRNKIKQQLREIKVRNQLAGDLHDEVGSSLSSIWLLSKMALNNRVDTTKSTDILEKISGNTKEVIDKMSDIVWMMNPKYDERGNLREKVEQYISGIKEIAPFTIHLDIDAALDDIKFPMEIRKSIFLIIKESVNNALKYSLASELNISLSVINHNIQLIVADNGKGFDKAMVVSGNGLETMALRTKNCKGSFNLQSSPCQGVLIKAVLPLPHSR